MLEWMKTKGAPVLTGPTDPSVRSKGPAGGPPAPPAPGGRGRGNPRGRGGAGARPARPVRPAGVRPAVRPQIAEKPSGPPPLTLAEQL